MNSLAIIAVLAASCLMVDSAFSARDELACTTLPELPTPRVMDASQPIAFSPPGLNDTHFEASIYPPNTQCEWQITMSDPDEPELTLDFLYFDLEYTTACRKDSLQIWEGTDDTGVNLGLSCGSVTNFTGLTTAGKNYFVRFISDDSGIEGMGFIGRAGPPIPDEACERNGPAVFTNPTGTFLTKGYPANFPNNALCEYSFQAPAGQNIELVFAEFDLGEDENCDDDYVQLWEGQTEMFGDPVARWYRDMLPAIITSRSNNLYMKMESDSSSNAPGFWGIYRFVDA